MRVRFSAEVSRYVSETAWHECQTLAPQTKGSVLNEFHVNGTAKIKQWLLSFGQHADLRQEAAAMLVYSSSRSKSRKNGKSARRGIDALQNSCKGSQRRMTAEERHQLLCVIRK